MKKAKWIIIPLLTMTIIFLALTTKNIMAVDADDKVDIMFTSDMHSHINSFNTNIDGKDQSVGGFSKIMTVINEQKKINKDTLLVDGGDFSMGTLFQTLYQSEAPELKLLGRMGYDATTLGNHEYDYRSEGLIDMLNSAFSNGANIPQILICNIKWNESNEEQMKLKSAFDKAGVKDYTIVEKNGVRIALIGVFGKEALSNAPTCALEFDDPVEAVKKTVEYIKEHENVDMYVCLSHSGVNSNSSKSEDEILAKKVPQLDVIISGHSHTLLETPIIYDNTVIVASGEYGEYVGKISLKKNDNNRWSVEDYNLTKIDDRVSQDNNLQSTIDSYEKMIDNTYLTQFGYTSNEIIAHNNYKFSTVNDIYYDHSDHNLGNIIADSYKYAVENANGFDGHKVDVAIAPSGTIRDTYVEGNLTVSDIFNSFSLGIGSDKVVGYPLVSVYLTGKELKTVAEVDASVSDIMKSARLYMSGMSMTFNPNRIILNKVTDVHLYDESDSYIEIDDNKLYRVVADLYSAQMLGTVNSMSYGILSLKPKYADGTLVTDFEDCIIKEDGKELKAWASIAKYFQSFDKNNEGISEIPATYNDGTKRKIVDNSKNILDLVKNLNVYSAVIIGVCVFVVLIIVLIVFFIVKHHRKKHKKTN